MQMYESFAHGFWAARSLEFYRQPLVNTLLWLRIVPDSTFILIGVIPTAAAVVWGFLNLRPATVPDGGEMPETTGEEEKVLTTA